MPGGEGGLDSGHAQSNRWVVLGLLILIYALNGADRVIISVLAEPMRIELKLSDTQLGLLSGILYAGFYTIFGIPMAWLTDRINRVRLIAGICLFWSACTAATGLSANFAQVALARVGVAMGETGCAPASYSLISDYFPPHRRATVLGIFSAGFPIGIAVGTAFAGWAAEHRGWRFAFMAMAFPSIILCGALLFVRHPLRGRLDPSHEKAVPSPPFGTVLKEFLADRVLWMVTIGNALASGASYAFLVWMPAFLMRSKGMTMGDIASVYAVVTGVAMVIGMLLSGAIVDRLGSITRQAPALVPACALIVAVPLELAVIWVPDWRIALAILAVPSMLVLMYLPPTLGILQNSSRPESRGVTAAICMMTSGIVGTGGGPTLVGFLSDTFSSLGIADPLHWALTAILPIFLLSALAYLGVAKELKRRGQG